MEENPIQIFDKINLEYQVEIPWFIENIPGLRLFDTIGEYMVLTHRRDKKMEKESGTIERKCDYQITITKFPTVELNDTKQDRDKPKLKPKQETITTKSFARAVKTHYAIKDYLNRVYPRENLC